MSRFSRIGHGFIFSLAAAVAVWGQSFSGKVAGQVTDASNAVIPNVAVTAVNEGTGVQRRLTTDSTRTYVATDLPVGYYLVLFEATCLARIALTHLKFDA